MAIGALISDPAEDEPNVITIGNNPNTVVMVVMIMGLSRDLPASVIAVVLSMPLSIDCLMISINTMALLTTIPASIIKPINTTTEMEVLLKYNAQTAPMNAKGTENKMTNGYTKDSNCDAKII